MPRSAIRAGIRKCWRWQSRRLRSIRTQTSNWSRRSGVGGFTFPKALVLAVECATNRLPFTIGLLMYSPQLLDHFQNPRNAGELAGADAVAEIENPACGDVLRLALTVGEGRITAARFKAMGCVAAIACGSALTE